MRPCPLRIALLLFCAIVLAAHGQNTEPSLSLRSGAEVRALSQSKAAAHLPVVLRGVVTFAFPEDFSAFVLHDSSAGVYINRLSPAEQNSMTRNFTGPLRPGALVELSGFTTPGGFAPTVSPTAIRLLGAADQPMAREVSVPDLLQGNLDCQRVRLRGVVQRATARNKAPVIRLEIGAAGGHLVAFAMDATGFDLEKLVNAEVEISGVVFSFFNKRGQLLGANVQIRGVEDLRILTTTEHDPRALPLSSIETLLTFSPNPPALHCQRIVGTVTANQPGSFLYLQENGRAIRVNTRDNQHISLGDRVEAVGFPEMRSFFAELNEATVRVVGRGEIPPAIEIKRAQILARNVDPGQPERSDIDGQQVRLRGRLEKLEARDQAGRRLYLDCDGHSVIAQLLDDEPAAKLAQLQPGCAVEVTGVCIVQLNTSWPATDWSQPTDFRLLIQSPTAINLLSSPSWWTKRRILTALALAALLVLAAGAWVIILRRQVAGQTELIRTHVIRETLVSDRSRMARELHDTLEQELMGLSFQLDAAADSLPDAPDTARQALASAQTLLNYTRAEARRSIWDLRALALDEHDLLSALRFMVAQLTRPEGPRIEVQAVGVCCKLAPRIEANFLRVTTEALTNALKHAQATQVQIVVTFGEKSVELSIADDGQGMGRETASAPGRFGLLGMRERARQIGANLFLESAPGKGVHWRLVLPLTAARPILAS